MMLKTNNLNFAALAAAAILFLGASVSQAQAAAQFDLPAQPLAAALRAVGSQTSTNVLFDPPLVEGLNAPALKAELTPGQAFARLLAGSGLKHRFLDDKTVMVISAATALSPGKTTAQVPQARTLRLAQSTQTDSSQKSTEAQNSEKSENAGPPSSENASGDVEEVLVTGSRLPQQKNAGISPVSSYSIEEIRETGALTVADFLAKLPQTYGGITAGRGSAPSDLNLQFGTRNENSSSPAPAQGSSPIVRPSPQPGVSGVSLRSLGSGSTLVLVDGRRVNQSPAGNSGTATDQGFVDLNTIPLGLIERIDVITDGMSAIYGADAVAGVINIILKKNWVGTQFDASQKFNPAPEESYGLTSGFASGKFSANVSLDYFERGNMFASQRDFSKNMDHTNEIIGTVSQGTATSPITGTDDRIQFGYAPVVQAFQGSRNPPNPPPPSPPNPSHKTFTNIPGISVVLDPAGSLTTPALSGFVPVTTTPPSQSNFNGQGQQPTNVSNLLELIPRAQRYGASGNLKYSFNDNLEGYGTYTFSSSYGIATGFPGVTSSTSFNGTKLLAASPVNPFGQDVFIGMINYGFGEESAAATTRAQSVTTGLRGKLGNWNWDSGVNWQQDNLSQVARRFNTLALQGMINPDPADPTKVLLNPLIDYSAPGAPNVSALYEKEAAYYETVDGLSKLLTWDFSADGRLFDLPGGPVLAAVGGSYETSAMHTLSMTGQTRSATPTNVPLVPLYVEGQRIVRAAYSEFSIPVVGQNNNLPLVRRLDLSIAGRYESYSYENYDGVGDVFVPKFGVVWSPIQSLLLRANYSKGFRAPSLTENQNGVDTTTFVQDPRNNLTPSNPLAADFIGPVVVSTARNPNLGPENSTSKFAGVTWNPGFVPGFNLQANYYITDQRNAIEILTFPEILANELLLPGLVQRSTTVVGSSGVGVITGITQQPINVGKVHLENADVILDYRLPWEKFGKWRFTTNGSHVVTANRTLSDAQPLIDDVGDTFAGPKWKTVSTLYWDRNNWNSSVTFSYMSGFNTNSAGATAQVNSTVTVDPSVPPIVTTFFPIPSTTKVDMRVGYKFDGGLFGLGKSLNVALMVDNLLDKDPPFYESIYGYNTALHGDFVKGRTFGLSVSAEF